MGFVQGGGEWQNNSGQWGTRLVRKTYNNNNTERERASTRVLMCATTSSFKAMSPTPGPSFTTMLRVLRVLRVSNSRIAIIVRLYGITDRGPRDR
uniref:Uncharacterized protein n=1 Tax=Romanomermis culicivorax TaxID=13658 RepID=A0A915IZU8_ROMCU